MSSPPKDAENPYSPPLVAIAQTNIEFFSQLPRNCPACDAKIDVDTRRCGPRMTTLSYGLLLGAVVAAGVIASILGALLGGIAFGVTFSVLLIPMAAPVFRRRKR